MSQNSLNYIVLRKSRIRNFLFFICLICALSARVIYSYNENFLKIIKNLKIFQPFEFEKSFAISFQSPLFLIIISIIIPFLSISIFEMFQVNGPFINRIKKISFYQITDASTPDHKLADLWYFIFSFLRNQIPLITIISSLGLSTFNNNISNSFDLFFKSFFGGYIYNLNGILPGIIAILIFDLKDYFFHWLQHNLDFLWDYHEFHHSATRMNLLNGSRLNIFETIFLEPLSFPINAFLGLIMANYLERGHFLPLLIYGTYLISVNIFGFLGHGNTKIILPRFLSFFLMSPSLHWIHHSNNPAHYNKNLGVLLSIWDRIFGTYASEHELSKIESYGVYNSEYNGKNPLNAYFVVPLVKTSRRIRKLLNY